MKGALDRAPGTRWPYGIDVVAAEIIDEIDTEEDGENADYDKSDRFARTHRRAPRSPIVPSTRSLRRTSSWRRSGFRSRQRIPAEGREGGKQSPRRSIARARPTLVP